VTFSPNLIYLRHATLPVAIGSAIYLLWRPTHLLAFHWFDSVNLGATLGGLREYVGVYQLPRFIVDSLPGGLWAWSFGAALAYVYRDSTNWLWCLSGGVIGVTSEFFQLIGIIPGTADLIDVTCYVGGTFLAVRIHPAYPFKRPVQNLLLENQ
jgi:hypothetical protein